MRFLTDNDVYSSATRFLMELGHDVVTALHVGMKRQGMLICCEVPSRKADFWSHKIVTLEDLFLARLRS